MRTLCGTIIAAAAAVAVAANAETIFEAKGLVTDKTPGFRFGNVTFTDNDRVCAKFDAVEMSETAKGRLTTKKLRLPHKEQGKGAYFKFSFDCKYVFTPGKPDGKPQRCNQGVFFYDKKGKVLPDCYDTLYPEQSWSSEFELEKGKFHSAPRHYERVLYAWDEVDTFEVFFQKPWQMNEKNGDRCSLEVSNVKIETATWEDAAKYCDDTYAKLPPLDFMPEGDWTTLLPRTMDALKTGKPWRVVMLGDSIMQDTFHSQFHALVKREFPKSDVEWILSMRGGTGCWHYIFADNFYPYVAAHRPDLLIIGGISNNAKREERHPSRQFIGPTGPDAMVRVAEAARKWLGCEVLIVNNPLAVDLRQYDAKRPDAPIPATGWNADQHQHICGNDYSYNKLKNMCRAAKIQWWDETSPCYTWLFGSGLPFQFYSRDSVHSGELGKQIIGRVMLGYFLTGR